MNQININKAKDNIKQYLKENQLLDFLQKDSGAYIGGSLIIFILGNKRIDSNDIDIYTQNYCKTFRYLNMYLGNKIHNFLKSSVNIKFNIESNKIPVQIITASFKDFKNDVLEQCDSSLNSVGYHPFTDEFIICDRFVESLNKKKFFVIHELTDQVRVHKLIYRAGKIFDSELEVIKKDITGNYKPYYLKIEQVETLHDVIPCPPPYLQIYTKKYICIGCKFKSDTLVCKECKETGFELFNKNIKKFDTNKKILILGGVNGFGRILGDVCESIGMDVTRTSRHPDTTNEKQMYFNLEDLAYCDEMIDVLIDSDYVVFNAYQTLEGDHSIWNNTLDNFDEELALDRFTVNCFGYVKLLKHIINVRKEQMNKKNNVKDMVLVYMDASESQFDNKLKDSKHLELNMAKTACKQIFYTNATLLASLRITVICYDIGWCSYHGISLEKIESRSVNLIPPQMSAYGLINELVSIDFDKLYDEEKYIYDRNVYDCLQTIMKNNFVFFL